MVRSVRVAATVPGDVYTDLARAGVLDNGDLLYRREIEYCIHENIDTKVKKP